MEKKIGFIGLGNMGSAIISGLLSKEIVKPENVLGYDKMEGVSEKLHQQLKITPVTDLKQAAQESDILFLAVKPNILSEVLPTISGDIRKETIVISIAAGKTIAYLEELLGRTDVKIVRCMPNTPAMVLEGATGVCANQNVDPVTEMPEVMKLLGAFSLAIQVPEKLMDVVVGVSGSSPAYVFMFIEAMADAAVAAGMPRNLSYQFAAQAVLGSAKLMLETGKHPGELKDMVCSPGGTTIQAVKVLEELGFRGAVMDAVEACIEKSKNI